MNAGPIDLSGRLEDVRERIARAARRSGRSPDDIRLIGVVKGVPAERVREAVQLGLQDLGENRVQEAREKIAIVGGEGVRWHMIGTLQRNKAARAAEMFDRIHGVDSYPLGVALSRGASHLVRNLPVLVQLNVTGEASKHGVAPGELERLLEQIAGLRGLALDGLMSIGPVEGGIERARASFALTRELRDRARRNLGLELPHLSMGMSGDFEAAIEEGSTMVRVGTALFGARDVHGKDP